MDTKITGILKDGDIEDFTSWIDGRIQKYCDSTSEISELKKLNQKMDLLVESITRIEKILEKNESILT